MSDFGWVLFVLSSMSALAVVVGFMWWLDRRDRRAAQARIAQRRVAEELLVPRRRVG